MDDAMMVVNSTLFIVRFKCLHCFFVFSIFISIFIPITLIRLLRGFDVVSTAYGSSSLAGSPSTHSDLR